MRPIPERRDSSDGMNKGFLYGAAAGLAAGASIAAMHAATWTPWDSAGVMLACTLAAGALGHFIGAAARRGREGHGSEGRFEALDDTVWDRLANMGNALDADD